MSPIHRLMEHVAGMDMLWVYCFRFKHYTKAQM